VIRHRAVALADVSSLVFFSGFGALVLGGVLFLTGVWHESVLRAGFMIAPGPLMAGLTAFPGGLLGARFGHRAVGTAGSLFFAAGGAFWIVHLGATPDWVGAYLPGSVMAGAGVGLLLPSLGGAATAPLPPERFATGTALYAMTRQIGVALGVACLVAIVGTAAGTAAASGAGAGAVTAFHHAWFFMIACGLVTGLVLQGIGARTRETADAGTVALDEERQTLRSQPVLPRSPSSSAPAAGGAGPGCADAYSLAGGR
jgi:MFS family permease